tara:strand:+ start:285 stop:560 length:276 start_codon:yes stop_codon:yes gene_type:complete
MHGNFFIMNREEYLKQVAETSRSLSWACTNYMVGKTRGTIEEVGRLQNKLRCRYGLTYAQILKASGLPEADFDEILYLAETDSEFVRYGDY